MKVREIMTAEPRTCTPETTLAAAANLMWEDDCGILPVVDEGELVGVVTDRDMYVALATRNERASQLRVGAVATRSVWTCAPEDDVHEALTRMKEHSVRRLPVVGFGNTVLGILSMNDVTRSADPNGPVRYEDVVDVLKAVCAHHHPSPHVVAA